MSDSRQVSESAPRKPPLDTEALRTRTIFPPLSGFDVWEAKRPEHLQTRNPPCTFADAVNCRVVSESPPDFSGDDTRRPGVHRAWLPDILGAFHEPVKNRGSGFCL